jgi:hypothetical protein
MERNNLDHLNLKEDDPMLKVFRFLVYKPVTSLLILLAIIIPIIMQAPKMQLDMSAETLMESGDNDALQVYLKTQETFKVPDNQLIIAYQTENGVLAPEHIAAITALRDELIALESVESVTTIVDVPLFESPPLSILDMSSITVTIDNGRAGKTLEQIKAEME